MKTPDTKGDPQSLDVEMAVLGAILIAPDEAFPLASKIIGEQDFYLEGHQLIYRAMLALHEYHTPPDQVALIHHLTQHDQLKQVGGTSYIMSLTNQVVTHQGIEDHCRLILTLSRSRSLLVAFERAKGNILQAQNPDQVISKMQQDMENVTSRGVRDDEIETMPDASSVEIERLIKLFNEGGKEATHGFSTGIDWINDNMIGGFHHGDLIVLGARPRTGKTHWGLTMLVSAMLAGAKVAAISVDMSRDRFMPYAIPLISTMLGEPIMKNEMLKPYFWGEMQEARLRDVVKAVSKAQQFHLIANPQSKSVNSICSYIVKLARMGVDVVMLDQLQNISEFRTAQREKNHGMMAWVVGELQNIARSTMVSLLLLHQIGRAGVDKPSLEHLRDTGSMEEYSDFVILLHDPQVTLLASPQHKGWKLGDNQWDIEPPGNAVVVYKDIENPRFISVDLAKTRSGVIEQHMVGFDYRYGIAVDWDDEKQQWDMPEGVRP